jgi:hypothetical protein
VPVAPQQTPPYFCKYKKDIIPRQPPSMAAGGLKWGQNNFKIIVIKLFLNSIHKTNIKYMV